MNLSVVIDNINLNTEYGSADIVHTSFEMYDNFSFNLFQ